MLAGFLALVTTYGIAFAAGGVTSQVVPRVGKWLMKQFTDAKSHLPRDDRDDTR